MKKIAVIPARYAATRFHAKLMQPLGNKTVIRHTYDNTLATGLFDDVMVATDNPIIFQEITSNGGHAVMSIKEHESGSDRIAEAVQDLDVDIIINIQGDEPFVNRQTIADLVAVFDDHTVSVGSLMHKLIDPDMVANPNVVKVITDKRGDALYFSRSPIPFNRSADPATSFFRHMGIYGYRKSALMQFIQWPISALEYAEKLEQLRYLENGVKIRMVETSVETIGIDTPDDLTRAQQYLNELNRLI